MTRPAPSRGRFRAQTETLLAALTIGLTSCDAAPVLGPLETGTLTQLSDPANWERLDAMDPPRRLRDPRTDIVFVRIPAGEFVHTLTQLGVERSVRITKPFLLAETEVTAAQFRRFAERAAPANSLPIPTTPELPMPLSWQDSQALCKALGYRLPTEAEWELACRASHGQPGGPPAPWSDPVQIREFAWFNATAGTGPKPVATRAPNSHGLHDMLGNVWEWCADHYTPVPFGQEPVPVVIDPTVVLDQPGRSLRGASWFTPGNPKPTDRTQDFPQTRNVFYGLRPARSL